MKCLTPLNSGDGGGIESAGEGERLGRWEMVADVYEDRRLGDEGDGGGGRASAGVSLEVI